MFSKAYNYMNEGCFQSASSCGKYPYIGDLHLQKFLIFTSYSMKYWGYHLVKILLDAKFSGIPLTELFLRERKQSENLYKNHL